MAADSSAIHGLTDAVRLLVQQIIELRREVRELRDRQGATLGWGEWAKTHPWPAALIMLALLLALSGQLSILPSLLGASIHALPLGQ
jgi:hypothetical protein